MSERHASSLFSKQSNAMLCTLNIVMDQTSGPGKHVAAESTVEKYRRVKCSQLFVSCQNSTDI